MTHFSERSTVQNPLLRYAQEVGWEYLPPKEALRLRGREDSPVLRTVLIEQLQRLNPGVVDSVAKAEEVLRHLVRVRPNIEGNLEAWEYLKGLKTVFVEAERRERNVRLLDPEDVEVNRFHVTDEFPFSNGTHTIRPETVFLVNGVPVIVVETKAATRLEGIAEAFDQIRRYHREGPEWMALLQLFALTHLVREEFYRYFRELEELFEILSPDPFLRPFVEDYEALAGMYRLVRSAYEPHVPVDKSFLRKTAEIVQRHTRTGRVLLPEEAHRIDAEMLERLAGEEKPETVKVFNLIKAFYKLVQQGKHRAPYLVSIGERAERIAKAFEERQISSREALRQLEALLRDYQAAERERRESDLSPEGFAVLWLMKREGIAKAKAEVLSREIAASFEQSPHWQRSERQERELRRAIYKALIDAGVECVVEWTDRLLAMLRRAGRG